MAHFRGSVVGGRGTASRLGHKATGLTTVAASWQGAVETRLYEKDGVDMALVYLKPWNGAGITKVLYEGPVGGQQ